MIYIRYSLCVQTETLVQTSRTKTGVIRHSHSNSTVFSYYGHLIVKLLIQIQLIKNVVAFGSKLHVLGTVQSDRSEELLYTFDPERGRQGLKGGMAPKPNHLRQFHEDLIG